MVNVKNDVENHFEGLKTFKIEGFSWYNHNPTYARHAYVRCTTCGKKIAIGGMSSVVVDIISQHPAGHPAGYPEAWWACRALGGKPPRAVELNKDFLISEEEMRRVMTFKP